MENNSYYFLLEEMRKQASEKIAAVSKGKSINIEENEFDTQWYAGEYFIYTGRALKVDNGTFYVEFEGSIVKVDLEKLTAESLMWLADIII